MIKLIALDWIIIAVFFTITISIGILSARKSAENEEEYFIGGRNMPWYLLGFSMVATTFSTDTPNLVTDLVRRYGVFGNWLWWSMLPTGMLTVFLYSKLWRRAGTVTDLEFYEMRYSGRAAAFLRGFRAVYLGLLFNIMVMATVSLAAIKIGAAMLGLTPVESVIYAMTGTVIFSSIGGFRGVIFSDFVLFILAMTGAVGAACIIVNQPEIGGLSGLASKLQAMDYSSHANMYSYQNKQDLYEVFLIPILIIWWSIWYPGAEPGGGGYQVQRMLAAKNENHAFGATLFFNISNYAIRPWPWILVALCSLVVFPDWNSMRQAIPPEILSDEKIQNDLAYSLMLTKLPAGWIGLVIASLLGAYMSTISTQLNWGASYLVNDCWKRFIRPGATQREMVWMGRVFTVILMILAGIMALMMTNALDSFQIMLSIGAGTGLIFLLRWFWWRINAAAEITAMVASFLFALYFKFVHPILLPDMKLSDNEKMVSGIVLTTLCWLMATYFGPQTEREKLRSFCATINPGGAGWRKIYQDAEREHQPIQSNHASPDIIVGVTATVTSSLAVYGILFAGGELLFKRYYSGMIGLTTALILVVFTWRLWQKVKTRRGSSVE